VSAVSWTADGLELHSPTGVRSGPVRALAFDLGGTLDADGLGWAERFRAHWRVLGIEAEGDRAAAALEAGERAVLDDRRARDLSLEEMVSLHAQAQIDALGEDPAQAGRLSERFAEETDETLRGRRPLLERLAARVPLAVVSNGCGNSARLVADAGLADLFAVVVDSSEAGYWKPDPRILEPVRAALDVPADAVAVVGDRLDRDGDAARSAGMQTVWVTGRRAPACDDPRLARVEAAVWSVTVLDPERTQ